MGQDCWSQKEALLTNCCHEIIYQIYASSMSLTHWYQYHQILPPRIWWQLTSISLSCLLAIWSMTNLVFMWRHWNVIYLLINICKYLSFHMKDTYLPVHLLPFKFCYADVQFDKKCIPKIGEILKKWWQWHHPMSNDHISELLWTMSILVSDILNLTLTEVQI